MPRLLLLMPLVMKGGNLQAAVDSVTTSAPAPDAKAAPTPDAKPELAPDAKLAPQAPPPKDHPSYISSASFALALLGSLDPEKPISVFDDVVSAATAMKPQGNLRSTLLAALSGAQGDLDKFRKIVANSFDDSMERLSGAYKRHLKLISIIVGLVIAVLFNADSFRVATTLWSDPDLRAQVVASANATAAKGIDSEGKIDEKKLKDAVASTSILRPLPIGWTRGKDVSLWPCIWSSLPPSSTQLLGWLLTAAALSLGAPFWFDILSKLVNIRGTGDKPDRADANSKRG